MTVDLAQLVDAAGDAIVVADSEGAITLWNPAAQRIFGYSAQEALGRSLDLIIPERFRERHWQGYRAVMRSGETRYGTEVLRVPALRKDGGALSIAFTVALLKGADGRVDAIAAIMRDVTARWNEERALKKRLAELEKAR
ncbi:MAG TPA: PAS domain S-box protein [Burkholderiales bacterium]|nr:PAS domain S-box protein [Burkholderiales bacterium]